MNELRVERRSERGQALVPFILMFITLCLFATVAVSVGQMLVRRQQAQMIVDAAAFSAASKQAEGLNTLAYINEGELNLLDAIYWTKIFFPPGLPYVDSYSTTEERSWDGPASLHNDWAGDVIEKYGDILDIMNTMMGLLNHAYSPMAYPRSVAAEVVDENFGDASDQLFKEEDLDGQGYVPIPSRATEIVDLVQLTDPETYTVNGLYLYMPLPVHWSILECEACPICPDCARTGWNYLLVNAAINGYRALNPFEYEAGRFYDNSEGNDVRFAYYLKVNTSPVLFGKQFFKEISSITVAAAAKPYGGYLGDEFDGGNWIPHSNQSGKEMSYTYKAKLVPLTNEEIVTLSALSGHADDTARNVMGTLH